MHTRPWLLIFALLATPLVSLADKATVAVAANFISPMKAIVAEFEAATSHKIDLVFGSSGKLYAQITHGAPFDVFFSADQETPARLARDKLAIGDSQFTYALGALALWSADARRVDTDGKVLKTDDYQHLAIANPQLAPYGRAAMEVLTTLGLADTVADRLVQGENIAQAYQFVASGNAELGFVALSQVWTDDAFPVGSGWVIPATLYSPIRQDAVLLKRGRDNPAAIALIRFVNSAESRRIITSFGYSQSQAND